MKNSIWHNLYKKITGKEIKTPDPYVGSLIDVERIKNIAPDAVTYEEMYLFADVFVLLTVINKNGIFRISYDLLIGDRTVPIDAKGVLVTEDDGDKLIFGIQRRS